MHYFISMLFYFNVYFISNLFEIITLPNKYKRVKKHSDNYI